MEEVANSPQVGNRRNGNGKRSRGIPWSSVLKSKVGIQIKDVPNVKNSMFKQIWYRPIGLLLGENFGVECMYVGG